MAHKPKRRKDNLQVKPKVYKRNKLVTASDLDPSSVAYSVIENQTARYHARNLGYRVVKLRAALSPDNKGLFQLLDNNNNVVLGHKFDALPSEIITYLKQQQKEN